MNHDHGCTATRAVPEGRTLGGNLAGFSFYALKGSGVQKLSAQRQARNPQAIREESEVTDAYEPFGEHVQK